MPDRIVYVCGSCDRAFMFEPHALQCPACLDYNLTRYNLDALLRERDSVHRVVAAARELVGRWPGDLDEGAVTDDNNE